VGVASTVRSIHNCDAFLRRHHPNAPGAMAIFPKNTVAAGREATSQTAAS
jgi:hypothetical protein